MALLLPSYIASTGQYCNEAYCKISSVRFDLDRKQFRVDTSIFLNKNTRINNLSPMEVKSFYITNEEEFDIYFNNDIASNEGSNHLKQSYEYLKTLSEFDGCMDDI